MPKKQKYVVCVTKHGIAEAIFKDFFDANPGKREDWEKRMYLENKGCEIKETSANIEKDLEKYGRFYEKERKEIQKEMEKIKNKVYIKKKSESEEENNKK